MDVVRHENPRQTAPASLGQLLPQAEDEIAAIDVVVKDRAAFDPTHEDVVTDPDAIATGDPCHGDPRDRGSRGYGRPWLCSSPE